MLKIFKKLRNLWRHRWTNIYIIQEVDSNDEIVEEFYFKKEKNRDFIHAQLLILDCSDHYERWCELREYPKDVNSWKEYLKNTPLVDKYILINGKVCANDIRLTYYSYEETLKLRKKNGY